MYNQQFVLDINQMRVESLNIFYDHILKQCELAKQDPEIYQEYLNLNTKQKVDAATSTNN